MLSPTIRSSDGYPIRRMEDLSISIPISISGNLVCNVFLHRIMTEK